MNIPMERMSELREKFLADKNNRLHMNAVTSAGIDNVAHSYASSINTPNVFSLQLPSGKITSQKKSGRCWLFAATNVLRMQVIKKLNLEDDFELSQPYLFFCDKLEKANYFLENIIATIDEPQGSRVLDWLLMAPFGDGGQWDMVIGLVKKYGIVPKTAMPETAVTGDSQTMNKLLTLKVREYAKVLRDAKNNGETSEMLSSKKESMLEEIFNMLCVCLGTPPSTFDFEIKTKDGKYVQDIGLTAKTFYDKYVGIDLGYYVSLINSPTTTKPFYRTYTVAHLGSVIEASPIRYLNIPIDELKEVALKQLKDNEPVWFGCDVGQRLDRNGGLMCLDNFDYETLMGTTFPLDKAARLDYGESLMTHAMVITGANIVDEKVNRWKVVNSWSEESGIKGWYRMSDAWFDEYVYQVVINKKHLTEKQLEALKLEPITLNPWDPMGSLA